MWRGRVACSIRGKRGQALLRELGDAMDAMPEKELITNELVEEGSYCALGVVGKARGLDIAAIDPEDSFTVAQRFNIAEPLAQEIAYLNDEGSWSETPSERWLRMRQWVRENLKEADCRTHAKALIKASGGVL